MSAPPVSRERAGRAVLWATIGWYSTFLLSFAFNIVTARLLVPEVFGLVGLVLVVVTVAEMFADAGTRAALIHREDRLDDAVSTAMISVPVAGFMGSCLIAACAPLFASFYGEPDLVWIAFAMAWLLFIFSLSIVPDALLQRRLDLKLRRAVVDPLAIVGYGITVIVGALMGLEVWALVIGQYVNFTIITVGCFILAKPKFRAGRASWGTYRSIARYGRGLLAANTIEAVESQAVPVALGRNMGPEAVGLWGAGQRIGKLPLTGIVHVTGGVVFATLARLQAEMERFRAVAFEALRMNAVLIVPVGVTFMALGEPIVVVLFGEIWRGAGVVLQFIGFWAVCLGLGESAREIFKALGRPLLVARAAVVEMLATLGIIAALWVADEISLWTVGLSRALSAFALLVFYMWGVHNTGALTFDMQWRAVRAPLAAGLAQGAVLVGLLVWLPAGFELWNTVGGVRVGPLAALGVITGMSLAGIAAYALVVLGLDRSVITLLRANVRTAVRGRSG